MRPIDFDQLDGLPLTGIMSALQRAGYHRISVHPRGSFATLAHPGRPDEMLTLSYQTDAAAALAALCAKDPANPYLPVMHEHRILPGVVPVAITATERLYDVIELPFEKMITFGGIGRATALLPEGDNVHVDAHSRMLKNDKLRSAVQAFAAAVTASVDKGADDALSYESGMGRRDAIDDPISNNVLFRKEGPGWRPVYAAPLRDISVRSAEHRATLRKDAAAMVARVTPKP